MPAFGFSAVPSPTKNRMNAEIGSEAVNDPVADALGELTAAADPINLAPGVAGSPLVVAAAGATTPPVPPNSRRANAAAVHANGAAAGLSEPPPKPSQDNKF